jgi:hypothetical protein
MRLNQTIESGSPIRGVKVTRGTLRINKLVYAKMRSALAMPFRFMPCGFHQIPNNGTGHADDDRHGPAAYGKNSERYH